MEHESQDCSENSEDRQVMISGIGGDCDEDMMQLIFSNQKRSGGGPIDRVEFEKDKDRMLITYEKQEGGNQSIVTGNSL